MDRMLCWPAVTVCVGGCVAALARQTPAARCRVSGRS